MSLLHLPNELLLLISETLNQQDLNSLLKTNHQLCSLLTPNLHRLAIQGLDEKTYTDQAHTQHHLKLLQATFRGYETLVRLLLETNRLDVNYYGGHQTSREIRHKTALHIAALQGHENIVHLFLDKGAEVDLQDTDYWRTPLLSAAKYKHEAVVRGLLERGANVMARDNFKRTALILAVQDSLPEFPCNKGYARVVARLLLRYGVEIDAQDSIGGTALHYAVRSGEKEVVELLLENGASTRVLCGFGETPVGWAHARSTSGEIISLLNGGRFNNPRGWLQWLRGLLGVEQVKRVK